MGQAGDDVTGLFGRALHDAEFVGAVGVGHGDGVLLDNDGIAVTVGCGLDKGITPRMPRQGNAADKLPVDGDVGIDAVRRLTCQKQQWRKRYE